MSVLSREEIDYTEKRKSRRETLKLWVHYKTIKNGKISDTLESITQDLSAGGVGLKADHELEPGQMLMVTLYLPPEERRQSVDDTLIVSEDKCMPISILSKIAWCQEAEDNDYRFGAQFIELDDVSRSILKKYFQHYELNTQRSPIFN